MSPLQYLHLLAFERGSQTIPAESNLRVRGWKVNRFSMARCPARMGSRQTKGEGDEFDLQPPGDSGMLLMNTRYLVLPQRIARSLIRVVSNPNLSSNLFTSNWYRNECIWIWARDNLSCGPPFLVTPISPNQNHDFLSNGITQELW